MSASGEFGTRDCVAERMAGGRLPGSDREISGARKPTAPATLPPQACAVCWSRRKIRFVGCMIMVCAAAGLPLLGAVDTGLRIVGLLWTSALALCLIELYRRTSERLPVVVIDHRGILDRRLLSRPIAWWEIAYVFPAGRESSRVVELQLRHADVTFASRSRLYCWFWRPIDQALRRLHLPDVCISLVLLDASPTQVLAAIARHRPDLVPRDSLPRPPEQHSSSGTTVIPGRLTG